MTLAAVRVVADELALRLAGPSPEDTQIIADRIARQVVRRLTEEQLLGRCGSTKTEPPRSWRCQLEAGHDGPHRTHTGRRTWR